MPLIDDRLADLGRRFADLAARLADGEHQEHESTLDLEVETKHERWATNDHRVVTRMRATLVIGDPRSDQWRLSVADAVQGLRQVADTLEAHALWVAAEPSLSWVDEATGLRSGPLPTDDEADHGATYEQVGGTVFVTDHGPEPTTTAVAAESIEVADLEAMELAEHLDGYLDDPEPGGAAS